MRDSLRGSHHAKCKIPSVFSPSQYVGRLSLLENKVVPAGIQQFVFPLGNGLTRQRDKLSRKDNDPDVLVHYSAVLGEGIGPCRRGT